MFALTKLRPTIKHRFWNYTDYRSVQACQPCPPPPPCAEANKPPKPKCPPPPPEPPTDWVSYGFDYENYYDDYNAHHASFFFSLTLCIIFGGFAWVYAPDVCLRDWAQREAFLELRKREAAGLPPIDPNYVPAKKVKIPSDKDLCDVEIVI